MLSSSEMSLEMQPQGEISCTGIKPKDKWLHLVHNCCCGTSNLLHEVAQIHDLYALQVGVCFYTIFVYIVYIIHIFTIYMGLYFWKILVLYSH